MTTRTPALAALRHSSHSDAARADALVAEAATANGYTPEEIRAGLEHAARKARRAHPPGDFDRAGRFEAHERTLAVRRARVPSRAYPYSELTAARTAAHCAELFGAQSLLAVKRVARARDTLNGGLPPSAHEKLAFLARAVKPVKRDA